MQRETDKEKQVAKHAVIVARQRAEDDAQKAAALKVIQGREAAAMQVRVLMRYRLIRYYPVRMPACFWTQKLRN